MMSISTETESGATTFGFTLGQSHTQTVWADTRHVSWTDLVEMLTSHVPGQKEGACLVPAVFRGSERKKGDAAQIDVAFLDSDSGATLDEIVAALKAQGWEAVVSSTHSHMTTKTEVSLTNWDRFFAKNPGATVADFLEQEKGYLTSVAVGAAGTATADGRVVIEHAPCAKFRIAVPLAKPWRAADYPSQGQANAVWKERIEALAAALGLWHDQACTDTSRLFYLPRRPPNGAIPETAVVSGQFCDIFSIKAVAAPDLLARPVNGKANGYAHTTGRYDYHDPITGEFIDLTDWARINGPDFLIAKALQTRRPAAFTGLIVDNTKVHIRCPNEDAHTTPGQDNATFVVNAGNGDTKGFVIHCRHAHCTGHDRLFFVSKMLIERWLSIDDLTTPAFLLERDIPDTAPDWPEDPGYLLSAAIDQPEVIAPDPTPVGEPLRVFNPWNTLRPVAFPMEALPGALAEFTENRARIIGADPCAIAWSCISACSAAIDGRVRLQMKRHDLWLVPPAIWLALIGLPSTKKSPIIDTAWAPLNKVQGADMRAHQLRMAEWRSTPKKERGEEPEMGRRLISHDATMEALQDILSKQDRGIAVLRDELAGWIGSLEKYAPGKGGAADRAFALQSYNGGNHVVDRVMRGMTPINNLLTTVCGGIQPDRLRQFGDLSDDGLLQRFVTIIVAAAGMGEDTESSQPYGYANIIERLLNVAPNLRIQLSDGAHEVREDVQRRVFSLEQSEVLGARFVGFCGKLVGLWGRLALVLHLISGADARPVSRAVAENAQRLLFRSVLPNAARVYTAMGGAGADMEATQSVAGYILTKRLVRILMSDLTSNVRVCRHKSAEDVRKVISPLVAGGWLLPEKEYEPTAWTVVSQVHVQFAEQAAKETIRRAAVRAIITGKDDSDVG
jgi:hypothetical protein